MLVYYQFNICSITTFCQVYYQFNVCSITTFCHDLLYSGRPWWGSGRHGVGERGVTPHAALS